MTSMHTISVPLPERALLTAEDEDDLRHLFEAIVGMRFEHEHDWRSVLVRLRSAGWTVDCTLQWHVIARREGEMEQAFGASRDEAFEKLDRVTRVETLEGTP